MKSLLLRLLVLATVLLGGCASTTPEYDKRFGDAVRLARQQMTINPQAGSQPDPVTGMDGPSAREAVQRYHDSFKAPPPVSNIINIGGASASP
jgi:hypothetical protein